MALHQVQAVVRLWFRDREGTEDYLRLYFPLGSNEGVIDLANGTYAGVAGALSDCRFCASDTTFVYVDDEPPTGAAADPDESEQWGTLFFQCDDPTNNRVAVDIPAFNPSAYLPDGVEINRAHPDVAALITALTTAGADACINPFGARLLHCDAGLRRFIPTLFAEATG